MSKIIDQVKKDIDAGAKEVTLLGQNVNSYIDPETHARFPELLKKVAEIDGEFWVRFMSPHPQDMTKDLFEVMATYGNKLCHYLHFPLQSGSNRILQLMNRNYSAEEYLEKIGWLRALMPEATLSTDIIVGFPGETEEDYQKTMDLLKIVKFDFVFSFIYSRRKYTKAFAMEDKCTRDIKITRLNALQTSQVEIAHALNFEKIGKKLKILVEKRLTDGKLLARTEGNIRVIVNSPQDFVNSFISVEIKEANVANLVGEIVNKNSQDL
jgi:tRNA-2-methylthio-N6-dimethylallyladenosine synthase